MKILIETSARHIHLSKEDLNVLFGPDFKLIIKKELSQPGQFVSEQRVDIEGPKNKIKGVSILGPTRKDTQIEISLTDARTLGISAPIRESGVLDGTPGCKLIGPHGSIDLKSGVIIAKRHIHLDTKIAKENNLINGQIVSVRVDSMQRAVIFGDVMVRVSDNFSPAMHIDTDEANSADISSVINGEIITNFN